MDVQDLIGRIEAAKNNLQGAKNQISTRDQTNLEATENHNNSSGYARGFAVEYAKRFAENPNPEYIEYDSDCTNFATQVLIAGGVIDYETARNRGLGYLFTKETYEPNNWGSDKRRLDPTFLRAAELPGYLENEGLATSRDINPTSKEAVHNEVREFLKPGDLIEYNTDDDPETDHINVFLGFDRNGVPMVANHTPGDIKELEWKEVKSLVHINDEQPSP